MQVEEITPILNVSDIHESFRWFELLGWKKGWEWGEPITFGGVCSGDYEIFLCQNGQGGRGKGSQAQTFGAPSSETADKGVWMSLWVKNLDDIYKQCKTQGIEITWEPTDMPWNVREMHIRHPDGHVFRISQSLTE